MYWIYWLFPQVRYNSSTSPILHFLYMEMIGFIASHFQIILSQTITTKHPSGLTADYKTLLEKQTCKGMRGNNTKLTTNLIFKILDPI